MPILQPARTTKPGVSAREWRREQIGKALFGSRWDELKAEAATKLEEMGVQGVPFKAGDLACQWCGTVPVEYECPNCGGWND